MRVALIGLIVVAFAFAAGAALGLSNGESGAGVSKVARPLGSEPRPGGLRLRPIDPGALPRPPSAAAAASPVQTPVGTPPVAPPPTDGRAAAAASPVQTPVGTPPLAPPPTDGRGSFDSSGPGVVPEANSFDSEG